MCPKIRPNSKSMKNGHKIWNFFRSFLFFEKRFLKTKIKIEEEISFFFFQKKFFSFFRWKKTCERQAPIWCVVFFQPAILAHPEDIRHEQREHALRVTFIFRLSTIKTKRRQRGFRRSKRDREREREEKTEEKRTPAHGQRQLCHAYCRTEKKKAFSLFLSPTCSMWSSGVVTRKKRKERKKNEAY